MMRIVFGLVLAACFAAVVLIGAAADSRGASAAYADDLDNYVPAEPKIEGIDDLSKDQATYAKTNEQTDPRYDAEADAASGQGDEIERLITYLTIFALAIFVGFEVITKVPPTLHTPLMSGSNAISGITIVGAILAGVSGDVQGREFLAGGLAFVAAALAMLNVAGGFVVTNRMLQMFRKKDRA
ncbi:MAG: NAD(P) transhydrogenase subunit alpha [Pirellulales bacterium]